ncbi:MAG: DNA methyltransferase [Gammaproteobacteria bacterium]
MPELNVQNRTLFIRDNVDILDNLNSECADLIYLDPPFNSNRNYAAPIGSRAAGVSFKDAWTLDDIDLAWVGQISERYPALSAVIDAAGIVGGKGDKAYLIFMARRLLEMRRILKPAGSIYLHCDPTMSHSLKLLMDAVFGGGSFRNEIVWCYTRMSSKNQKQLSKAHDIIFWYSKTARKNWTFNVDDIRLPYAESSKKREGMTLNRLGSGYSKEGVTVLNPGGKFPEDWIRHIPYLRQNERTGYPTQKPLALLERIIKASTNEGDVVLDPFCGCATTLVAAETLNRQWVGIDVSKKAEDLINMRLQNAQDMLSTKGAWKKVITREDCPARTDNGAVMVNKKEQAHILYGKQEGNCAGCRFHFPFRNMTVDHEKPKSKGGQTTAENLQLLCGACNSVKGNRSMAYLLAKLKEQGIIS